MSIQTLKVEFNFRMTVPTDGSWSDDAHRQNWELIRSALLQVHGVCGCLFRQASGEIEFYSNMTNYDTVLAELQAIVDDLTETAPTSFFPDHGDQRVVVSQDPAQLPKPTNLMTITVTFPSDLSSAGLDNFTEVQAQVMKLMLNFDGARDGEVYINSASLTFDTGRITQAAAERHLSEVFHDLRELGYFPFYHAEHLSLTFTVKNNV